MYKWLMENGVIKNDEIEIYTYGMKSAIIWLSNVALTLVIAHVMNMLIPCIFFMTSYMILRSYAGGYHAKSQKACYILSNILVVLALITVKNIYQCPQICIYVLAISTLVIMKLAPIEAKNKPLDIMEVIVYRRKAITTLWILILIALILLFLDLHIYFASIVVAIMCVSIMLILGKYLT